ncbi:hypothetical protein BD779DRAFT_140972 [Infundibulicybe gibba]|nr:hypothetical protein BD779DRAFT_140972 [Infundibulicybe gibba]
MSRIFLMPQPVPKNHPARPPPQKKMPKAGGNQVTSPPSYSPNSTKTSTLSCQNLPNSRFRKSPQGFPSANLLSRIL